MCCAYYLALQGTAVTLLEAESVACAASGKAAGFISGSAGMCTPTNRDLQQRSFVLHLKLAQELDGHARYDFRAVPQSYGILSIDTADSSDSGDNSSDSSDSSTPSLSWLRKSIDLIRIENQDDEVRIDNEECSGLGQLEYDSALLHPRKFTQTLLHEAQMRFGVRVRTGDAGRVVSLGFDEVEGQAARVVRVETADGNTLSGFDACILALGPWMAPVIAAIPAGIVPRSVAAAFSSIGRLSHSVVLHPLRVHIAAGTALFWEQTRNLGKTTVEEENDFYLRPGNRVYSSGASLLLHPVPALASLVLPDPVCVDRMLRTAACLSAELVVVEPNTQEPREATCVLERADACFTPFIGDDETHCTLGLLPGTQGVYVAGGHGVWGVCQGPASGQAMARLVLDDITDSASDDASSLDVEPFSALHHLDEDLLD